MLSLLNTLRKASTSLGFFFDCVGSVVNVELFTVVSLPSKTNVVLAPLDDGASMEFWRKEDNCQESLEKQLILSTCRLKNRVFSSLDQLNF